MAIAEKIVAAESEVERLALAKKSEWARAIDTANLVDAMESHKHDIPADLDLGHSIAIDTETQGLSMVRDKLCLVQLSTGDGISQSSNKAATGPRMNSLKRSSPMPPLMCFICISSKRF